MDKQLEKGAQLMPYNYHQLINKAPTPPAPRPDLPMFSDWWKPTLKGVGVGAGVGVTAASLLNLLHQIKLERRRAKDEKTPKRTDEGTIVLTLPDKAAVVLGDSAKEPIKVGSRAKATSSSKTVPAKSYRAGHYSNQAMKKAQIWGADEKARPGNARSLQLALRYLGTGAGAVGGYKLVDALYKAQSRRKLQTEEDQARTELLDMLAGKTASCELFDEMDKVAGPIDFINKLRTGAAEGVSDIGGVGLLMGILGTGGTAYLTKKLLDLKAEERDEEGYDPPKLKRVLFRSSPVKVASLTEGEVPFDEDDHKALKCAVLVMMDKLSAETKVLSDPAVQVAMKKAGLTTKDMFQLVAPAPELFSKESQQANMVGDYLKNNPQYHKQLMDQGVGPFMDTMSKNPDVMNSVIAAGSKQHPMLGFMPRSAQERLVSGKIQPHLQSYYDTHSNAGAGAGANAGSHASGMGVGYGAEGAPPAASSTPGAGNMLLTEGAKPAPPASLGTKANDMWGQLKNFAGGVDWASVARRWGPVAMGALLTYMMTRGQRGKERTSSYMPLALGAGASAWDAYGRPYPGKQRPDWLPKPVMPIFKGAGLMAPLVTSVAGSGIARQLFDEKQPELVEEDPITKREARKMVRGVDIDAADPRAQEFLELNRIKIKKLLEELALQGKV